MHQDDEEEDKLFNYRVKAVSKEFLKMFLKEDHVTKGPGGQDGDASPPDDPAAESAARFLFGEGKAIIEKLKFEATHELRDLLPSRSVFEIGWEELSTLCNNVFRRCSSWLREKDDRTRAVLVMVGTVAQELFSQGGISEQARQVRVEMLEGHVADVLREHNLEDCITDRQGNVRVLLLLL